MRILITGANGQLGKDLVRVLESSGFEVYGYGRDQLDITNLSKVRNLIQSIRPDAVIHSAAYTAVDLAESEEVQAYQVNAFGTRNVALVTEEIGAKLCYISTDYVFDGTSDKPYREYDNTNPQSVYGKSKRAGEQFAQRLSSKCFIVRTSWVYGLYGKNFVKTMLQLAQKQLQANDQIQANAGQVNGQNQSSSEKQLKVLHDQQGSPTYTIDLSRFLAQLVQTENYGIYHASNSGACTWYEFAQAIFEEANQTVEVAPCTTEEFPRPAPRPMDSVMEHLSIQANGFEDLRHWRDALREFIGQLREQQPEFFKLL